MKTVLHTLLLLSFLACTPAEPAGEVEAEAAGAETRAAEPSVPLTVDTLSPAAAEYVARTPDSTFTTDYLMGKFDPAKHPDFATVDAQYTDGGQTYYLRKEVYEAFKRMHTAAKADGVNLRIISATRNFDRQKTIWEAKWTGERLLEGNEAAPQAYPDPKDRALAILRWSSMPGSSRHHWGTDMDLNSLENGYFMEGKGRGIYEWLRAHGHEYGFCQPYSPKGPRRPDGYNEEKWHWSYAPTARQLTELARRELRDEMISGFQGAEAAKAINVVKKYVLGVNAECME